MIPICIHLIFGLLLHPNNVNSLATNPEIIEHPENQYVTVNKPASLNCRTSGNPQPNVTWYKNGQPVISSNEDSQSNTMILPSGQLFFMKVNPEHHVGVYYCNATNPQTGFSVISNKAVVQISTQNVSFVENPSNKDVALGTVATFTCKPPPGESPLTIEWRKDGQRLKIDRMNVTKSGTLRISDVRKDDGGIYTCLVLGQNGERESQPAQLTVREKPRIVEGPKDMVVKEHENVVFNCRATGDPEPTIIWKKLNSNIPQGRSFIQDNKSLKIEKVDSSDEGIYICRAENAFGFQESGVQLNVHFPPQFVITPRDKTVLAGSRVNFRCSVTGNPTPAVFWLKENSQTLMFPKKDYDRLSVTDDGTLMIDNVKKSDAGQYLCKGVNDAGQAYYKAKLEVKDSDDKMHPPIIKLSPQNQTLAANTEATLLCSASGDPTPSIVWLRNNKVLNKKDDKYSIDDSGNLKIKNLRKSDSGKYTCKAFNKIGETSRTCYIQVEAHTNPSVVFYRTPEPSTFPGPPSKPTIADVTDTSVRLMWRNNQNSGSSAVFAYTVEYSSLESGQGWMEASNKVTEQTYIVRNLKPDTYYTFLVRAQNSHGLSLPSPVSDHVRTKGGHNPSQARPNISALNRSLVAEKISNKSFVFLFPAEATGSTTVVLTWEVRKNHRYVEGFHIRYRCLSDVDDHFYPRGYHSNFNDRGTDLPEEPKNWTIVTVQSSSVTSYTLYNLEKNTWFEMDVQPYYMDIVGMESNKVQVKTLEDVPSASPQHIEARMTKNNTLSISWEPPPKQHHNGFLRGYKIFIFGNNSKFDREIQINSSMRELRIQNMIQDMTYKIQMCAYNRAGDGFRSDPIVIGPLLTSSPDPHLLKQPWFIAMLILLIGGLLWTVLCVFSVWLCRKRSKGIKLHKNCLPNSYMVDNSINAGKVNGYVTTTSTNYPTLSKQNANFINATVNNSNNSNNNNNLQSPGSMKNFNKTVNPYNSSDIIPCIIQQQYMIQPKSESTDSGIKQNISTSESNIDSNHLQDYDDHAAEDGQQYERIDFNLPDEINLFGEHPTLFIPPPPEHPPPTYNSTNASQSPPNAPRWLASQQLPLLPPPHHVAMHSDVEPMNNNYNNNNINNNNIILGSNIVGSLKRGMHTLNYSINKPPSPKNANNFASTSRPLQNNNNNISNNNIHHVSSERAFEQHQQPFHQRNKSNYSQQLNPNYSLNARLMPAMKNNLRTSHPTSPDSPISEVAILDTDYDVDESDADMNLSQLAQSPSHSDIDNMIGQEPAAVIEGGDQWRNDDMAGEDESSSVSSSDDNNCLTEKDFAKAVARAAKMSGLMVVGSTVIDPNTGKEKVRKSSKHRQRARCSSPYSTDSNYSSIPHKHHPKSERKKRTKMQASQQPINSSQQHLQQQQQQLRQQMLMRNHSNSQKMIDFNNSSTNFNLLDGNVNKLTHGSSIPLLNNSNESKNTFNNGDFSRCAR